MNNFEIEEIPMVMNDPIVSNSQPQQVTSDLENVIQLQSPVETLCEDKKNIMENLEKNIDFPLEEEIFEIQAECKNHKFFGNITKKKISSPNKQNNGSWGMYLITGALVATVGSQLL